MGFCSRDAVRLGISQAVIIVSLVCTIGCQIPQPGLSNRLTAHAATVDLSGLIPDKRLDALKIRIAVPEGWDAMVPQSTAVYDHQQWRSPSRLTGVGVAYIHLPVPMSAKTLVWFAKMAYAKQNSADHHLDPKTLGEWTDSIGREWFEGENEKYHVKGYVVTNGMDAWVIYSGYRLSAGKRASEINMAFRTVDSIVPLPLIKHANDVTSGHLADSTEESAGERLAN